MNSIEKYNYNGKCWWCGNPADSNEHKIKRSIYNKFYGRGSYKDLNENEPLLIKESKRFKLQSSNDKNLTFVKTLCQYCNNEKSQPFDKAFDIFIDYYLKNQEILINDSTIDYQKIFGNDWQIQKLNLIRYYVKFFSCQIATGNYKVSADIVDFLNGSNNLKHIKIHFQIKIAIVNLILVSQALNYKFPFLHIGDTFYYKNSKFGFIETIFNWYTIDGLSVNFVYNKNIENSGIYREYDVLLDKWESIEIVDTNRCPSFLNKDILDLFNIFENSDVDINDKFKIELVNKILNK